MKSAAGNEPVGSLADPALAAFVVQAVGPIVAAADRSWPRDGSRVWELTSASEQRVYLKQHQTQRFHDREVSAYRHWAPALGDSRAPRLLRGDPRLRAILITALPGQPALAPHVTPADEPEIHRQAGALLRRLHGITPGGMCSGTCRVTAGAERHITRAGTLLTRADARLIRRHAEHLTQTADHLPLVPTHGDVQPRNLLWDPVARRTALIDFERAEPGPAVRDLIRLEYGPWHDQPDLRDAFLDGYGRTLTTDEEHALQDLAALDAASAIGWGSANNDTDVLNRGYQTLARLHRKQALPPVGRSKGTGTRSGSSSLAPTAGQVLPPASTAPPRSILRSSHGSRPMYSYGPRITPGRRTRLAGAPNTLTTARSLAASPPVPEPVRRQQPGRRRNRVSALTLVLVGLRLIGQRLRRPPPVRLTVEMSTYRPAWPRSAPAAASTTPGA